MLPFAISSPDRLELVAQLKIYDISRPLSKSTPVWPGDAPFRYTMNLRMAAGASVNLGSFCTTAHVGTHADAPLHFDDGALPISELDLSAYIGPAVVIDVAGRSIIHVEDIAHEALESAPRLLLRTGAWLDAETFPQSIPVIANDVPEFLKSKGVVLLGVDVPSVDSLESKDLPNHHGLHANRIRILESLFLDDVAPGIYELVALPLKLEGADGSPVRAILRTLPESGRDSHRG